MHGWTQKHLEELLSQSGLSKSENSDPAHCPDCGREVAAMREQSELLRSLQVAPAEAETLEPAAGFYARVLQCIEEHARRSIWYGLAYSTFGRRLAYASLSLALILGLYVVSAERMETSEFAHGASSPQAAQEVSNAPTPDAQRDAVLVNFASYSTTADQ